MNEIEILESIGYVDQDLIEKSEEYKKPKKKTSWIKAASLAACICIAFGGLIKFKGKDDPTPVIPSSPNITVSGMGFEGKLFYDISQLKWGNPWTEDSEINTLPVYMNKAYDASGAGVPTGLEESQMYEMLQNAASNLDLEIINYEPIAKEGSAPTVIRMNTNKGRLDITASGILTYTLTDGWLELPEGYSFTMYDTKDDEAEKSLEYLAALYSGLVNFEDPKCISYGDYNFDGQFRREYRVYDASGDDAEDILNYNFESAVFVPGYDGKLNFIRISNDLLAAKKIGDYPVISVENAKQKLCSGEYLTSVPYKFPGEEYIEMTELVYRKGSLEEILMPYYRFYVLLPGFETENGLQNYGAYYVPAVEY